MSDLLFCRFCAESELSCDVIDFSTDIKLSEEIVTNISFLTVHDVDFTDKILPKAVCTSCRGILSLCCKFLRKIRRSQIILRDFLNENKFIENSTLSTASTDYGNDFDSEGQSAYGYTEMKNEILIEDASNSMDFEENPIKLEPKEVFAVDINRLNRVGAASQPENAKSKPALKAKYQFKPGTKYVQVLVNQHSSKVLVQDNVSKESLKLNTASTERPPSSIVINKRARTDNKPYICEICNAVFYIRVRYNKHKLIHTDRKRDFTCHECGKSFITLPGLKGHQNSMHRNDPQTCTTCGKVFRNIARLRKHSIRHGELKYECDLCHRTFRTKISVSNHIWTTHSDKKPFLCNICGKRFKMKPQLRVHLNVHKKETPYSCSECGRKFTMWGNCDKHMKRIHGLTLSKTVLTPLGRVPIEQINRATILNKEIENIETHITKVFACEACGKTFDSQKVLKQHEKVAHDSDKKTQVCPICKKVYTNMICLKAHLKTHVVVDASPSFDCEMCYRTFKTKNAIARHMTFHVRDGEC